MNMEGEWASQIGPNNKYQYNGKELNDDFGLNWLAFEARWYDPAIGRFIGSDPIADDFAYLSPYNYASNSPVTNIDLWGLQGYHSSRAFQREQFKKGGASENQLQQFDQQTESIGNVVRKVGKVGLIGLLAAVQPEVGIPLAIGDATGIPVTPSPAAMEATTARTAINVSLKKTFEGADDFAMAFANDEVLGSVGVSEMGTSLEASITVPASMQKQGVLTDVITQAVNKWNPSQIKGTWNANFNGKPSTNYSIFTKNLKSMTAQEAAFSTPTGKAASANGFTGAPIIEATNDGFQVIFTLPN